MSFPGWIEEHFVPAPGGRRPTEEEFGTFSDLAQQADRLVMQPTRQAILFMLFEGEPVSNAVLMRVTAQSAGALHTHLRRLEGAGYITVEKLFDEGRRPKTRYRITADGREAVHRTFRRQRAASSIDLSGG